MSPLALSKVRTSLDSSINSSATLPIIFLAGAPGLALALSGYRG